MKLSNLILPLALAPLAALAGEHVYRIDQAKYVEECGSCHVAYPPQLLEAQGWRALMTGLDRHFGADASLDARTAAEINAWLERNAGTRARLASVAEPRISATRWFRHEHDEVPASLWRSAGVKTPANCSACHRAAEKGDYSERSLRLPRP